MGITIQIGGVVRPQKLNPRPASLFLFRVARQRSRHFVLNENRKFVFGDDLADLWLYQLMQLCLLFLWLVKPTSFSKFKINHVQKFRNKPSEIVCKKHFLYLNRFFYKNNFCLFF
jgi:hypothetical protein